MIDYSDKKDILAHDACVVIFPFFKNAAEDKEHTLDELVNFYMNQLLLQFESHRI